MKRRLSYSGTGVDIDSTDAAKRRMARSVDSGDPRVLNKLGAFASVVEGSFCGIAEPVLVLKTDEPGSKQKLSFELDRVESLCDDLVHHIINDVAVMGAHPLYLLDCIVGGSLDPEVIDRLVAGMARTCQAQGAVLVGGETSIQPGVVPTGVYVLSATAIGVADRSHLVDGSKIQQGDTVLAVASNGLHTNGYTLVRALLETDGELSTAPVDGSTFLDVVMRPHHCYYSALRPLFGDEDLHGLAHITGGGLRDNIARILPSTIDVHLNLPSLLIPAVFRMIRERGGVEDEDMLRTYNLGCGLVVICHPNAAARITEHFRGYETECWTIGRVMEGSGGVLCCGEITWA